MKLVDTRNKKLLITQLHFNNSHDGMYKMNEGLPEQEEKFVYQ